MLSSGQLGRTHRRQWRKSLQDSPACRRFSVLESGPVPPIPPHTRRTRWVVLPLLLLVSAAAATASPPSAHAGQLEAKKAEAARVENEIMQLNARGGRGGRSVRQRPVPAAVGPASRGRQHPPAGAGESKSAAGPPAARLDPGVRVQERQPRCRGVRAGRHVGDQPDRPARLRLAGKQEPSRGARTDPHQRAADQAPSGGADRRPATGPPPGQDARRPGPRRAVAAEPSSRRCCKASRATSRT